MLILSGTRRTDSVAEGLKHATSLQVRVCLARPLVEVEIMTPEPAGKEMETLDGNGFKTSRFTFDM